MSPKVIGLVGHPHKRGMAALATALREEFTQAGVTLLIDQAAAEVLGDPRAGHRIAELGRECELLIVLGGDGTILSTVHALDGAYPPIFGINLGTLGFLTCVAAVDYRAAVQDIVQQRYVLSQRTLLEVRLMRGGAVIDTHLGLNDAVISRGALSRLIRLETRAGGTLLNEYNADGLIIATPTGSTAYSLSAGGPLLTPDASVFAVTPICPHTLTNRSIIIGDQNCIEVRPCGVRDEIYLTVDGQRAIPMGASDTVQIRRATQTLALATMPDLSFFELARRKLKWNGSSI
jgi:NAD+ kinase